LFGPVLLRINTTAKLHLKIVMEDSVLKKKIVLRRSNDDAFEAKCNSPLRGECERTGYCLSEVFLHYLDISSSIIVVLDHSGRVRFVNKSACDLFGIDRESIIGVSWIERFIPEKDRAVCNRIFEQIVSGEVTAIERFENKVIRRDGSERLISWHNSVMYDNAGKVEATLSSGEDITEKRRIENKLQEMIARLSMAELIAGLGHWSLDMGTKRMDWSDQVCRLLGEKYDDMPETLERFFDCIHPGDRDRIVDQFMHFCISDTVLVTDFKVNLPDDRVRYLQLNAEKASSRSESQKIFGTLFDITNRKISETENLERKDIALQEVLQQVEGARLELGRRVQQNVESVVYPLLARLETSENAHTRDLVRITRDSLSSVIQPFTNALRNRCLSLTPRETEICNMIRLGMSSKEIASAFGTSEGTVKQQRKTIRKKLGISGKSDNLTSVLKKLSEEVKQPS